MIPFVITLSFCAGFGFCLWLVSFINHELDTLP
jgi:nitrate reductase NapE component